MKCFKNVAFYLTLTFIFKKLHFYNRNFELIIKMKLCFVEKTKNRFWRVMVSHDMVQLYMMMSFIIAWNRFILHDIVSFNLSFKIIIYFRTERRVRRFLSRRPSSQKNDKTRRSWKVQNAKTENLSGNESGSRQKSKISKAKNVRNRNSWHRNEPD